MPRPPARKRPAPRPRKKASASRINLSALWAAVQPYFHLAGKGLVLLMIWGGIALAGVIAWYAYDMPDIRQVTQPQRRPSITLLADDGTVFARYGDLYGQRVGVRDVPAHLIEAILAIEDRRFFSHFGVDPIGMARAMARNALAGRVVQGGSTLTQQLAKNLFLTPERTTRRKVQEMLLAFWLEHTYSKEQILTAYLNRVYLGAGTYGVDAAADVYFGKSVTALTLRESAIMAGLLRAPSRFAPTNNPGLAIKRAAVVLAAMVDAGFITEAEKDAAMRDAPMAARTKPAGTDDGRYFADWVVDQVGALLENAPQDITVLTTLDLKLQRAAERKVDGLLAAEGAAKNVEEASLVTLTRDGAVRAMVGGRDYAASQFNRAVQARRQPGSSFKPIVYLAGLQVGLTPDDVMEDEPLRIGKWSPHNYDNKYRGPVTLRNALAESINTIAVRVLQKAGVSNVVQTARALGVTSDMDADLSLALGTNSVSPLEMTGVYAALATGGRAVMPYAIKEIRSREGRALYQRDDVNLPLTVDPQSVATLVGMMQDVVNYGTGRRAALDRPVAGKTGTSSDYRDAWFLGFTGNYVTGVWMGNDDNKPMKKVTGGNLPAQLWHDFMVEAERDRAPQSLLADLPSSNRSRLPELSDTAPVREDDFIGSLIQSLTGR